jgi:hypothetical protein
MPDFFHRHMIVTYAPCIERHRLLLLFERFFLLMTMKLHKVAQLRRVEATSSYLQGRYPISYLAMRFACACFAGSTRQRKTKPR